MPHDRRDFIKRFGVTLGSLIASGSLSGCGPQKDGGLSDTERQVKKQDEPSPTPRAPQWEQLRQCWLSLDTLAEDINKVARPNVDGLRTRDALNEWLAAMEAIPKRRIASHQAVLNALVETGQLDEPVGKQMQIAFEEAVYHVDRSRATCYMIFPFEGTVRQDLLQQADVLRKLSGDLDPATVARAQAAIAQDVAYFEIFKAGKDAYSQSLRDNYKAGSLKASPEALEAARLLTQLFLETAD